MIQSATLFDHLAYCENPTSCLYNVMSSFSIRCTPNLDRATCQQVLPEIAHNCSTASAISALPSTMNPVRPCSTISGNAPERNAMTGVPDASASMATSELVSATRLGMSRQRALASSQLSRIWFAMKCVRMLYPTRGSGSVWT